MAVVVGEEWVPGRLLVGAGPAPVGRRCAAGKLRLYEGGLPKSILAEVKSLEGGGSNEMMKFYQV